MSKEKKRDPLKVLLWVTGVTVVLALAAGLLGSFITTYRQDRLAALVTQANETNAQKDEEYYAALADFQAQQQSGANLAWPAQKTEGWDVVDLTNYPLESPTTVSLSRADVMNGGMLLVNQWHSRPDDFQETDLQSVGQYTKWAIQVPDANAKLFPLAIDALQSALTDAAAVGLTDFMVQEAYRSMDDQNTLFQAKVESLSKKYSGDELIEQAKKSVNYPGTSEYQSGLSFRMKLYSKTDATITNSKFSTSAQGQWFYENCWQYGIIFRFPLSDFPAKGTSDKSYKTGISTEMNVYRYVGKGNAAAMHTLDLCLEEYIDYLLEHPHIAVFQDGVIKYEIVRQTVGDAQSFQVNLTGKTANYDCSLDNMGGLVTVFSY